VRKFKMHVDYHNVQWIDFVTSLSTLLAVLFAAFSAWTSNVSAKAARDAVDEARLARQTELAPKLILEKEFLDLRFFWPHAESLNGEAVFLSRKHWKDTAIAVPTFTLQNFGQSPALEVTIVWQLEDPNEEFHDSDALRSLGLSIHESSNQGIQFLTLRYPRPDGTATEIPLYRRWTTDIPSCSPNQKRVVDFPTHILNTLFLRGIQTGAAAPDNEIVLTAIVNSYAVDEVAYRSQFRWRVIPFYHGGRDPVVVHSHFFEMPNYPKPAGPRVA
jgi:hypothetical protein